jgi:MFS family permease
LIKWHLVGSLALLIDLIWHSKNMALIARPRLTAMVAILCFAFLISQFYRASVGVLAPSLIDEFSLSGKQLGNLGGSYFLIFAAAQVPCGVLLDRYGPRRVNSLLFLLVAFGAAIFAYAQTPGHLVTGRSIIGLGCATCLMGTLVIFSRWFPARKFPLMVAVATGIGGSGALAATVPLAWADNFLGWRDSFLLMAAITALVAYLIWLLVRDNPPHTKHSSVAAESFGQTMSGIGQIATNRQLVLLLPLNTVSYGSTMVLLGLWGTPYFRDVHGATTFQASQLLMGMAAGLMAGGLLYAWLVPKLQSVKKLVLFGASSSGLLFLTIAYLPPTDPALLMGLVCLQGILCGYGVLIISHVRTLMPQRMMGRGLTLANLFGFGGVGCLQVLSGWIMNRFETTGGAYSPAAYSMLFATVACLVLAATLIYLKTTEVDLTSPDESISNTHTLK